MAGLAPTFGRGAMTNSWVDIKNADVVMIMGIVHYHPPGGMGVRIDSHVYQGYTIPPYYDSLLGKLIVHGKTRTECVMRLKRALDEFVVDGVETTLPLFRALVDDPDILAGDYHIHWLERFLARGGPAS